MARLLTEAAAAALAVAASGVAAASVVNHPRLMGHRQVEAAGHRPRMARLPAVAEVSVAAVSVAAASEVGHPLRATERLLRPTARPPRAMGHRAAAVVAEVDTLEVEADRRPAMERPVPAAAAALAAEVPEEVDIPVVVVEYLHNMVHPREVAVDILEVAAADTLAVAVAVDIPEVAADTLAVVDIPAVTADTLAEGKMRNKCETIQQQSKNCFCRFMRDIGSMD